MPNPISSGPSPVPTDSEPDSLECLNPPTSDADKGELTTVPAVQRLVAQFSKPAEFGSLNEQSLYKHAEYAADGELQRGSMGVYNQQNSDGSGATLLEFALQKGEDKNVQLTVERSNFAIEHRSGFGLSLSGDVGVFRANSGVHNDDGSVGYNIGLSAEAAGLEATVSTPVASVTLGASVSWGLSGSSGFRDADHDGKPEYCARVSVPAFTFGGCLERFW